MAGAGDPGQVPEHGVTAAPPAGALRPTARGERVAALDALRGAAVLGILLVNVQYFQGPQRFLGDGLEPWTGADRTAAYLITALVEGKFITGFAFLFGVGIALQSARAEARGQPAGRLMARRLAVLALFGAVHSLLLWYGDVLLTYALLGFVLVAARRAAPRTLLRWAAGLYGVGAALLLVTAALPAEGTGLPALAEQGVRAYQSGSYADMFGQRLRELGVYWLSFPFNGPWILAPMLAGLAAGRAGLHARLAEAAALLRRVAALGVGVGVPVSLLAAAFSPSAALAFAPLVSLGYLALGALLLPRARSLALVGRMALTNYLLQTVLATAVYYGLGLYGRGTLVAALGLTVAIWAVNLLVSRLWLARFDSGPVETLWRRWTYGRASVPRTAGTGQE
jgi:uncharacterized protein